MAILAVFGIGYGKLVWSNRLAKKHEGKDEEQRIAVEESRRCGQMVETRKSQDIPFGVRAIQSGIQVDGIWISKDSTPIPTSLNLGHMRNSTSELTGNKGHSPRASIDSSQVTVPPTSSRGRMARRESESGTLAVDQHSKSTEVQDVRGCRPSYKPRRSSHLRYDSHGETNYNEETLGQLEGKTRAETKSRTHRQGGTLEIENDASSGAAADNERSSGSDTDVTLSSNTRERTHDQLPSFAAQYSGVSSFSDTTRAASSRPPRSSLPLQSPQSEYFPIPLESPGKDKLDPFIASTSIATDVSLPFKPPHTRAARELTASGESQVPLLSHSRSPSTFIPGELHMNKSVRKVNSGFEVLPAGTFSVPAEFKGKRVDRDERWNQDDDPGEKRQSNKLQKKIRTSVSSRRPSSIFESP